jgi:hypothetical protein
MKASKDPQQAEILDRGHEVQADAYPNVTDGKHLNMPGAGVKHGGTINYDTPTRSDSNNETGPS